MTNITNTKRSYSVAGNLVPKGYEQVTGLSAVKGLTVPSGARIARIQAETQNVRWRDDGTDPTTSVGNILASGSDFVYDGSLSAIKFIEVSSSAKLNVHYYG